jgi:molybdopterin converting factor subunit 1
MRVKVLYFGVLREVFGDGGTMELPAGADVAALLAEHRERATSVAWASIAVAVNQEYAKGDIALHEGDEVALLPPVSGGWCGALASLANARQRECAVNDAD